MKRTAQILIATMAIAGIQLVGGTAFAGTPTCSEQLGIANHGQHIVGDYVSGLGHEGEWPYNGSVGSTIAGEGAAMPGAPAAHGHFGAGIAPGASFCTGSSNPGIHL